MLAVYRLVAQDWNFPFLLILIGVALVFGVLTGRFTNIKLHSKQPILFLLGLTLVYFTMGSPLSAISHLSFSTHMIFMSIHYFIIPPLLLLGIPYSLFIQIENIPWIRWVENLFFPPTFALYTFALLFFMYHLSPILQAFSQYPLFHTIYMLLLLYLSFSIYWPVASPDPNQRLDVKGRKDYAVKSGLLLMPACSYFILMGLLGGMFSLPAHFKISATLCLPSNFDLTELLSFSINSRIDQIVAGILMLGIHKLGLLITLHHVNKNS